MNKFAIITGASRGIGLAVAKYLASQGYDLAFIAKNKDGLVKAQTEIIKHFDKIEVSIHDIDVADADNVYTLMKNIIAERGHLDVLVNNAGVFSRGTADISIDGFERMHAINVNGMFAVAKAAAEVMIKQKSGYIFNMASMAGKRPVVGLGAYCASKYAVVGFSESLFQELTPHNVKVTAVCPGVVDTDMAKNVDMPNEHKIQPSDIVATIDYLLHLSFNAVISSIDIRCRAVDG